jgi:hypothetical protein
MEVIKLLCFRWLSSFFRHVQKGFLEFAKGQATFSIHVMWVHFQFLQIKNLNVFLISPSTVKITVLLNMVQDSLADWHQHL